MGHNLTSKLSLDFLKCIHGKLDFSIKRCLDKTNLDKITMKPNYFDYSAIFVHYVLIFNWYLQMLGSS